MSLPIGRLTPRNFLSFGPDAPAVELRGLNILVGPNGSGKSNLVEALAFLRGAIGDLGTFFRGGGGSAPYIWKGGNAADSATVEVSGMTPDHAEFEHSLAFANAGATYEITGERILTRPSNGQPVANASYAYEDGAATFRPSPRRKRTLKPGEWNASQSVLSDRQDEGFERAFRPISRLYQSFRIYRARQFNQIDVARGAVATDLPNRFLEPDGHNLAPVLNRLLGDKDARRAIDESMAQFYEGYEGIATQVQAGTIQVFLIEERFRAPIPATRLSDGTLRWLVLLAILADPEPPPLVCLEEPETGLHPDAVVALARLLEEASSRTQLIVTTHSDTLIDCFSEAPESVLVCEKAAGSTTLTRLVESDLHAWLGEYGLGRLWRRNQFGGNRW